MSVQKPVEDANPPANPPAGFKPHSRRSPFTDPFEPLFARIDAGHYSLGTRLRPVHCNSRGLVHGGFIATLADNGMGLCCGLALSEAGRKILGMVTVNLAVDYVGQAQVGDWLETQSTVIKLGGSLAFLETRLVSNGITVARANATFKVKTA
ncbi:PaaI thioesterase [Algimonas arctica]|uniref:PaaI thioesterase n=1 Tax=Algimonas arctica TaxID=1479486 RepID=A0A8J3CQP6_9PROT|nr:PaaI family thioesterase [Algimonas arctica]GHA87031.1 PaaI thioesterase [Algimonas arctica]